MWAAATQRDDQNRTSKFRRTSRRSAQALPGIPVTQDTSRQRVPHTLRKRERGLRLRPRPGTAEGGKLRRSDSGHRLCVVMLPHSSRSVKARRFIAGAAHQGRRRDIAVVHPGPGARPAAAREAAYGDGGQVFGTAQTSPSASSVDRVEAAQVHGPRIIAQGLSFRKLKLVLEVGHRHSRNVR